MLKLDLSSLASAYERGALAPADLARQLCSHRPADDNPVWICRLPEDAVLEQVRAIESRRSAGESLPLFGVPFAVKDNIDVAGLPTTAGCPAFSYTPKATATAVSRLLDAGAILLGKTNLDQFATGLDGTRSPYGVCRNPFDPRYIAGGSSSGSALAVAGGWASFALGTDTAGSNRVPAAFNNIVGLKPTRGLVSAAGVVPACRSLDCVAVFALSCSDALQVLSIIRGFDPADIYSRRPTGHVAFAANGFRFAVPREHQLEFFGDSDYAALFERSVLHLRGLGGCPVEIDFSPFLAVRELLYEGPWIAERYAQFGSFIAEHPGAVLPVIAKLIGAGAAYSAADAFRAQYRLAALRRESEATWQTADFLLLPAAPTIFTLDEARADPASASAHLGLYTNFVNLLDLAAVNVPAGFRPDGLPFGVSLVGPAFSEMSLGAVGARIHAATCGTAGAAGGRELRQDGARLATGGWLPQQQLHTTELNFLNGGTA